MSDFTDEQAKQNLTEFSIRHLTEFSIRHLCKMLREDPDYRYSWQANIAMAFMDEFDHKVQNRQYILETGSPINRSMLSDFANAAADRFLNLLARDQETQSVSNE